MLEIKYRKPVLEPIVCRHQISLLEGVLRDRDLRSRPGLATIRS